MSIFEKKYVISYIDVDDQNELTNRGFIKYMQEVGGDHSSSVGYGLNQLTKLNMAWIILNWNIKVYNRPHCNDTITIKTWISNFNKIFAYRDFEIYDEKGHLIAIATSKWVLKNHEKKTIIRFDEKLIKAYDVQEKSVIDDDKWDKNIAIPASFSYEYEYTVIRRDIDTNHHVNNLFYIDFANEALPQEVYDAKPGSIEIQYKKEIKYKEIIVCKYAYKDNEHIIVITNTDMSTIYAVVRFK